MKSVVNVLTEICAVNVQTLNFIVNSGPSVLYGRYAGRGRRRGKGTWAHRKNGLRVSGYGLK